LPNHHCNIIRNILLYLKIVLASCLAYGTMRHPQRIKERTLTMSDIIDELNSLTELKRRVFTAVKNGNAEIATLTTKNQYLTNSVNRFLIKADKKRKTVEQRYQKSLALIDADLARQISASQNQIEENKVNISRIQTNINDLSSNFFIPEVTLNTEKPVKEKVRKSSRIFKSKVTKQMLWDAILEYRNSLLTPAFRAMSCYRFIKNKYASLLDSSELIGESSSLLYARMFNVYSEMRRKNILHKATGQGVVAFKQQDTENVLTN